MQNKTYLGFAICILVTLTSTIKLPCQYTVTNWPTNLQLYLSDREVVVSTKYNFDMIVDAKDKTVSKAIIDKGVWQSTQVHVIAHFLKPGYRVVNLGPQSGLQAVMMGRLIGGSGRLFIAQPNSVAYRMVKKNIYLNDLQDITTLYHVAASDVQTQHLMVTFQQNTGAARIYDFANYPTDLTNRDYQSELVQVDLIDNVIPKDQKIDFMLIDAQKMEVEALLGMRQLIERSRDVVMLVEWQYSVNQLRNQTKTLRCLNWLKSMDFKFYAHRPVKDNKCAVGQFSPLQVIDLMTLQPADIVIVPGSMDPNKL